MLVPLLLGSMDENEGAHTHSAPAHTRVEAVMPHVLVKLRPTGQMLRKDRPW